MTEDEWFVRGSEHLIEWRAAVVHPRLSELEENAFDYAWELAGREAGIIK